MVDRLRMRTILKNDKFRRQKPGVRSWLAILMLLAFVLVACQEQEPEVAPTEAPTEAPVEAPTEAPVEEPTGLRPKKRLASNQSNYLLASLTTW